MPNSRANETIMAAVTPEFDALAEEAMTEWKVPAVAVAVVQNGETVILKAYGQRDAEAGLPTTPQTQFTICSITKTFTATGLAMLVDEGRLDWTKPVRDYVPEFRLHDPIATDRITVRDLLSHHSGLPRHDWVWMPADLSRAEMLAAMRHIEPSRDIRTAYQYSNLGYNAASMVAERISGLSWEDFTRTRITERLKMPVTFTVEDLASAEDAAAPYSIHRDQRQRTKFWPIHAAAAGGINTSVAAIANWMKFLLSEGKFENEQLAVRGFNSRDAGTARLLLRSGIRVRSYPLWPRIRLIDLSRRAGRRPFRRLDWLEHADAADAPPESRDRGVLQSLGSSRSGHPDQLPVRPGL